MRKTAVAKSHRVAGDDLRPEYHFDYRKARPNRFAGRVDKSRLVVALDPDISEVFTTPEAVNATLRALITAMSPTTKPKAVRRSTPRTAKK